MRNVVVTYLRLVVLIVCSSNKAYRPRRIKGVQTGTVSNCALYNELIGVCIFLFEMNATFKYAC